MRTLGILVAAGAILAAHPSGACTLSGFGTGTLSLAGPGYRAVVRPDPVRIERGTPFALDIQICAEAGAAAIERIGIDASMPEHRHGMNYKPSLTARTGGRYRAEGLMFHMPGRWELAIEIRAGDRTHVLTQDIRLP